MKWTIKSVRDFVNGTLFKDVKDEDKMVQIAPTTEIDKYPFEVKRILKALGHEEAFVTDESRFWDFYVGLVSPAEADDLIQDALDPLGMRYFFNNTSRILDAAALLHTMSTSVDNSSELQ